MARSSRLLSAARIGTIAALAVLAAPSAMAQDEERSEGEIKLERMLEGRVAGEPVRCIQNFVDQRLRVIDGTAYVYGRGDTIYVQRTASPENIDRDDILITRPFAVTRLCRLDQVTTRNRYSGFFNGAVFFEEFVPYSRVDEDEASDS
ncbi:MAG: hypothetical protein ABJP48_03750 [Erythrobacter sp.]